MCLAIPGKLVEITGNNGVIDLYGVRRDVRLDLIDQPEVGDYVLVHAGFALEKTDESHAKELEYFLKQSIEAEEDAT